MKFSFKDKCRCILSVFTLLSLSSCGGSGSNPEPVKVLPTPVPNVAPTVDAGVDQTVDENTIVTLSGTATDSDGTISSYSWAQTSGITVTLTDADSITATFTAPDITADETLTFSLTVVDNDGASSIDSVDIIARKVNTAPSVNAGEDQTVDENTVVTITGTASDSDGTIASYSWAQTSGITVTLTDADSITATFTAPDITADETLTFSLTVVDNDGASSIDSVDIIARKVNTAPSVSAGEDQTVDENTVVTITGTASDSDGTIASYSWAQTGGTSVDLTNADSASATFTAPDITADETLTFSLTVVDNDGASSSDSIDINVQDFKQGISGTLRLERIGFKVGDEVAVENYGLDPNNPSLAPIRFVVVHLLDSNGNVLSSAVSDNAGGYYFPLQESDMGNTYAIKLVSQLELDEQIDDGFKVVVKDQSTAANIDQQLMYHYTTATFEYSDTETIQNVDLPAGWDDNTKSFIQSNSKAQPFAILDSVYKGARFLLSSGIELADAIEPLTINWTQTTGHIEANNQGGAFYNGGSNRIFLSGEFLDDFPIVAKINEWDEHTIIHEFAHFYQRQVIGRDDSSGGLHNTWALATLPLAFSEGLASAIAFAALDDWSGKSTPKDITSGHSFDDLYEIALGNQNGTLTSSDYNGSQYSRPTYIKSPYEEVTNSYFVLSFIADKASTERTTNLSQEIGMNGLHAALKNIANQAPLTTVYSLAAEIKKLYPQQASMVSELEAKLDFTAEDGWGSTQAAIASNKMYVYDAPLPEETYLPIYVQADADSAVNVCFNGGMHSSISNKRPGVVRYARFKANQDGMVTLKMPDGVDVAGNSHSYEMTVWQNGQNPDNTHYFPNGNLDELEFLAIKDKEYVITLFGNRYAEAPEYNINETVCADLNIVTQ